MRLAAGFVVLLLGTVAFADCDEARLIEPSVEAGDVEGLQQLVLLCPTLPRLEKLGNAQFLAGQYLEALESYTASVSLARSDKEKAMMLGRKGQVLAQLERFCESVADLDQARELFAEDAPDWIEKLIFAVESAWTSQPVSAAEMNCLVDTRRAWQAVPTINVPVHFAYDSADISDDAAEQIDQIAAMLQRFVGEYDVRFVGHTDSQGAEDYNMSLSERRAKAVVKYLTDNHELAAEISSLGRGEYNLRHKGDSEEVHRLNRRVEVQLIPQSGS